MNSAIVLIDNKIIYNVPIFIQIVLWCKMRAVPNAWADNNSTTWLQRVNKQFENARWLPLDVQRTPGMLMNTLPAHCNALPAHSRYANERTPSALQHTPTHFRYANERTPKRTRTHFTYANERTSSALPKHIFLI